MESIEKLRDKIRLDVNNPWSDLKGDLLAMVDEIEAEIAENSELCDEIDALTARRSELESENRELRKRLAMAEAEAKRTDDGWMRLPVDMNGETIFMGDVLESDVLGRIEVVGFVHGAVAFWSYDPQPARLAMCPCNLTRHVKSRTVEDVLAEFRFEASCIYDDPNIGGDDMADALYALDEKFAAEIFKLMETGE